MRNIIIDLLNSDRWKIQLIITINSISSKDVEEGRLMHSSSDNIKFTSYNDADEDVDALFELPRSRYQGNLESSIRGSDFHFRFSSTDALQK